MNTTQERRDKSTSPADSPKRSPSPSALTHRLSALDTLFVDIESDTAPMHIGVLSLYKGKIPFRRYQDYLNKRLHLIPRYRQCITQVPLHLGHPTWEDDVHFDISRHVHKTQLRPPGSDLQLRNLAERLFSKRLDLTLPPWQQYVIEGLAGNRTAVLTMLHHALADGVSSVDILRAMHDDPAHPNAQYTAEFHPRALPPLTKRMMEAVTDDISIPLEMLRGLKEDIAQLAPGLAEGKRLGAVGQAVSVFRRYAFPAKQLPFDIHKLSGEKRFGWCCFPLEPIRQASHVLGGTVNDAVLTIVAGGVQRYLKSGAEALPAHDFNITVPVNVRRPSQEGKMGNQISIQPVSVPLADPDCGRRFAAINRQTRALKSAHAADGLHMIVQLLQGIPSLLQYQLARIYDHPSATALLSLVTSFPTQHTICTNVTGPAHPVHILGRKCIALHPLAPVIGGMGLIFPCVSYDGCLYLSAVADRAAVPHMQRLKRCLDAAHAELLREAAYAME